MDQVLDPHGRLSDNLQYGSSQMDLIHMVDYPPVLVQWT